MTRSTPPCARSPPNLSRTKSITQSSAAWRSWRTDTCAPPSMWTCWSAPTASKRYTAPWRAAAICRSSPTVATCATRARGVRVEFLVSGRFPGDGKPKPVTFPDPAVVAEVIDGVHYVNLPTLINLKLAFGVTNPGRLRDLTDVQELIRALRLPAAFAAQLHQFVHSKFDERSAREQNIDTQPPSVARAHAMQMRVSPTPAYPPPARSIRPARPLSQT